MSYIVKAYNLGKIELSPSDSVSEILQNISVILSTPQCSVPLERGLGLPMRFIDKPIPVAQAILVAEVNESIREQEPRVNVVDVSFEFDEDAPGKLVPVVEVEIIDE